MMGGYGTMFLMPILWIVVIGLIVWAVAAAVRRPGELSTQAGLAQGNQRLVITQPSGEADQDGGPDCAPCSADCLPIG